jgi:hypothetical protein
LASYPLSVDLAALMQASEGSSLAVYQCSHYTVIAFRYYRSAQVPEYWALYHPNDFAFDENIPVPDFTINSAATVPERLFPAAQPRNLP